eukprot:TRINITY_DN19948_c0_g1_i1.p1 TRINITY_DN19948_c0_g1~~TRINITY_DN19948_c0_g1_i1.p1  ORF type:complete len:348 (+),score=105.03 TRINITY_DN19948_c0_g1_i1:88-1131(+)
MAHRVETLRSHLSPTQRGAPLASSGASGQPKGITVVGACFIDYISYVDRFPQGGETLHCNLFQKGFGGKGANQAVMCGRLGGRCKMVGMVGADGDGAEYLENFKREGIDTTSVVRCTGESTGLAKILVDKSGENLIVICPNATGRISVEHLQKTAPQWLAGTDIVVCQNEVPLDANLYALEAASKAGKMTVFVPAPAPTPEQLPKMRPAMKYVSIFTPNQHEAAIMLGTTVRGVQQGLQAAVDLRDRVLRPDSQVCITMGSDGAIVLEQGAAQAVHVPPFPVPKEQVVDTTGAGDCWAGALCYFLSIGEGLLKAAEKANACAAISVQKKGTQSSYPHRSELPAAMFR